MGGAAPREADDEDSDCEDAADDEEEVEAAAR